MEKKSIKERAKAGARKAAKEATEDFKTFLHDTKEEISDKDFVKMVTDFAGTIPTEVYLSLILSYAWSKTHEGMINKNDFLLGSIGGFTLPSALKGGVAANAYALSYLGALGLNFVDQPIKDWLETNGPFDYIGDAIAGTLEKMGVYPPPETKPVEQPTNQY